MTIERSRFDGQTYVRAHRPAMDENCPVITGAAGPPSRGSETEAEPALFGGDSLDLADWGPVERSARTVSLAQYLLAALTGWGRTGAVGEGLAPPFGTAGCPRPT
jgi:hypothetical protein